MDKIIFATGNKNKMIEIKMILSDLGAEILSQKEAGIEAEVVEDGTTFEENALIKAEAISKIARSMPEYKNTVVLADDSGLEIDYLNKEPGIYSARYMGEDTSYDIKNNELLRRLEGVPKEKRTARFVCAVAAAFPDGTCEVLRGTMEGIIGYKTAGENGFGYDPIFYLPEYQCTSAELTPEKKNELSHRGEGLRRMRRILEERLGKQDENINCK
ncbi:RdgB/HAM1 family non-canonical purine NTP pyrophosphatase [Lachnospiraceae bacterium 42-17]|jgi:XTP/dITP diphosphohydrolase|nr:RdgB/HAM1 family non-canonical purine NTP pyrophosphatase [Dorea sp.]